MLTRRQQLSCGEKFQEIQAVGGEKYGFDYGDFDVST